MADLTPGEMLNEFFLHFGLSRWSEPTPLIGEERDTASDLVGEEYREYLAALRDRDVVKLADACADLIYTAAYTAVKAGIPIDRVLAEVHASNLTKELGPTWPDGKCVVKGDGYRPPDVAGLLS